MSRDERFRTWLVGMASAVGVSALLAQPAILAQGTEQLTNEAVVQMALGKLPKDLILTKIRTSSPMFDLTSSGLVFLTQNKVSEEVLKTMLERAAEEAGGTAAAPGEVLTNDDVVSMIAARVPKAILMAKIQRTANAFDVTASGLVGLNNSKVPKDVITAMMTPSAVPAAPANNQPARATAAPQPPARTADAPVKPRAARAAAPAARMPTDPGIYLYADDGSGPEFLLLEPAPYTAARTSGKLMAVLTYGISKVYINAILRGSRASVSTNDGSAEFYFVFEQKQTNLSNTTSPWLGAAVTSPNQFSLARLNVTAKGRELSVAAGSAFGQEVGTDAKATIEFTLQRLKPGVYRVIPRDLLAPGQYAFVTNVGMESEKTGRLFDFGVGQ